MRRALLLLAAAGCASTPLTAPPISTRGQCSASADAQAALTGRQSCTTSADCVVVVQPPCLGGFVAVSAAAEPDVEHAFSVIEAEDCPLCGGGGGAEGGVGGFGEPAASCGAATANVCGLVPATSTGGTGGGLGAVGTFGWACPEACGSGEYCAIENDVTACPRWPGYYTVGDGGGFCALAQGSPGLCQLDSDCGYDEYCATDGGSGGVCSHGCPYAWEPASCAAGCQLTSDNQGCYICDCPDGCPDAGPPR